MFEDDDFSNPLHPNHPCTIPIGSFIFCSLLEAFIWIHVTVCYELVDRWKLFDVSLKHLSHMLGSSTSDLDTDKWIGMRDQVLLQLLVLKYENCPKFAEMMAWSAETNVVYSLASKTDFIFGSGLSSKMTLQATPKFCPGMNTFGELLTTFCQQCCAGRVARYNGSLDEYCPEYLKEGANILVLSDDTTEQFCAVGSTELVTVGRVGLPALANIVKDKELTGLSALVVQCGSKDLLNSTHFCFYASLKELVAEV